MLSAMLRHQRSVFVATCLAACSILPTRKNPDYCAMQSDCPNGTSCNLETHACVSGCATDDNCTTTTPFCNVADGTCHECGPLGEHSDCPADRPICQPDLTCRRCVHVMASSDCPDSGVCLDDGSCARPDNVIYVNASAAIDNPTCAKETPCQSLITALQAVSATRNLISLAAGTYSPTQALSIASAVMIWGPNRSSTADPPAAVIDRSGTGPTLLLAADVALRDLRVSGSSNTGAGIDGTAIRCQLAGSKLTLLRVHVTENAYFGIEDDGCPLTIEQSVFHTNRMGGVALKNAPFTITNSFFHSNGTAGGPLTSEVGGLVLEGIGLSNVFAFNTVASNQVSSSIGVAGVDCRTPGLRASSNIVSANLGDEVTTPGLCQWDHSIVDVTGPGNMNVDPLFVDRPGGNLHLTPGSPASTAGATDIPIAVDIDSEQRARPTGTTPDSGADEID